MRLSPNAKFQPRDSRLGLASRLAHVYHRQGRAIRKRHFNTLGFDVSSRAIHRYTRKRGAHFEAPESSGLRSALTNFENSASDSAPSPFRMDEERANLGCILARIKKRILPSRTMIAAKQSLAFAPSATTDQRGLVTQYRFGHEVRSIRNKLSIHAHQRA